MCQAPKAPCKENAGACNVTGGQSSSMGIINSDLQLSDKSTAPFLLYISGSVCSSLQKGWTTKIEFVCQTDGMTAGPKIIENSNCTLVINFVTKLVCRNEVSWHFHVTIIPLIPVVCHSHFHLLRIYSLFQIQCKARDVFTDREIDLTPLKSAAYNYLARINDTLKASQPKGVLVSYLIIFSHWSASEL